MKNKLISLFLCVPLLLSGCNTTTPFDPNYLRPVVGAAVLILANDYAKKTPENIGKILDLAILLETVANIASNTLSKQDFIDLVSKIDSKWSVLGVSLYNVYAQYVVVPEKYEQHSVILKELATALRDSTLFVNPSK